MLMVVWIYCCCSCEGGAWTPRIALDDDGGCGEQTLFLFGFWNLMIDFMSKRESPVANLEVLVNGQRMGSKGWRDFDALVGG